METLGSLGTNHGHVTSSGASMKITPSQWPVILISALGKSNGGSAGRAQHEQTKRNAWHSEGATKRKRRGETELKKKSGKERKQRATRTERYLIVQSRCLLSFCALLF